MIIKFRKWLIPTIWINLSHYAQLWVLSGTQWSILSTAPKTIDGISTCVSLQMRWMSTSQRWGKSTNSRALTYLWICCSFKYLNVTIVASLLGTKNAQNSYHHSHFRAIHVSCHLKHVFLDHFWRVVFLLSL